MATTDNLSAQRYAANAAVSAAEAKSYADVAGLSEDFSNQAKASADAAAAAESSSVDAATSALESENNAALSAAIASEAAQNATITSNLYPTLAAAQAAITDGTIPVNALFNVAVPAGSTPPRFADQYQNVAGVATLTGQTVVSGEMVDSINQVVSIGYQKATVVSGTENAIAITIPRYFADGTPVFFTANLTNTGAVTISVTNAAGVSASSSILKEGNSPLAAGDIAANNPALIVYRGAPINNWILIASGGVAIAL